MSHTSFKTSRFLATPNAISDKKRWQLDD